MSDLIFLRNRKKQLADTSNATKVISEGEDIQVTLVNGAPSTGSVPIVPAVSAPITASNPTETFIGQKYKKFENMKLDDDDEPPKPTEVKQGNQSWIHPNFFEGPLIIIYSRKTQRKELNR